jgi:hypothetical protein
MGERKRPRVEQVGRPCPAAEGAVVRPGLHEADGAVLILAQARGEHAPGRAAADDEDVEPLRHEG